MNEAKGVRDMKDQDAIAEFERWFSYVDREQRRADELQRLAALALTRPTEAQRQLRQLDRTPKVYDGANLYPAIRHAWRRLNERVQASQACPAPGGKNFPFAE